MIQYLFAHPVGDVLVHALPEGGAEGAVTVVAANIFNIV